MNFDMRHDGSVLLFILNNTGECILCVLAHKKWKNDVDLQISISVLKIDASSICARVQKVIITSFSQNLRFILLIPEAVLLKWM